jgi:transketolase
MRTAFSSALVELAKRDRKVLLLTGDHGYALFDSFRRECPEQYINAGIAEQNMVGMAAGLARMGFKPFVYGLAAFIPVRVVEQIKLDIAHDNLPVVLLGDGAGFVYSHLGTSHQSTEDIACTRSIPNLTILSPADRFEQTLCMQWAYECQGPVYMRMGKSDKGNVHSAPLNDPLGSLLRLRTNDCADVALIATGSMVKTALDLAESALHNVSVYSVPSIKPLKLPQILDVIKKHRLLVTLEEHHVEGGLGSLVCETSSRYLPRQVLRIGVEDRFSEHCGTYDYLLDEHGISTEKTKLKILDFLASCAL